MRAVLILCVVVATAGAPAIAQSNIELIDAAKDRVTRDLKDPDSAKFRGVKAFPNGVVCGEVNAKNSFGAYTGFRAFGYTRQGFPIAPPPNNLSGDYAKYALEAFYKRCEEAK